MNLEMDFLQRVEIYFLETTPPLRTWLSQETKPLSGISLKVEKPSEIASWLEVLLKSV